MARRCPVPARAPRSATIEPFPTSDKSGGFPRICRRSRSSRLLGLCGCRLANARRQIRTIGSRGSICVRFVQSSPLVTPQNWGQPEIRRLKTDRGPPPPARRFSSSPRSAASQMVGASAHSSHHRQSWLAAHRRPGMMIFFLRTEGVIGFRCGLFPGRVVLRQERLDLVPVPGSAPAPSSHSFAEFAARISFAAPSEICQGCASSLYGPPRHQALRLDRLHEVAVVRSRTKPAR